MVALAVALVAALVGWPRQEPPRNVLLITLDTIRTERLGCYGDREASTPAIDALAAGGVLFERANATAPLTLPSHASILSGTYPTRHGVRDNGASLIPQELITLAETLRERGWRTGAFVGAYVLSARWGLDQGFEVYEGEFDVQDPRVSSIGDLERPAGAVVDDALRWLRQEDDRPFFAWVHLFDPHTPYHPPSPFRERHADPYDGEVAYADSQIARLVAATAGMPDGARNLIVFAGDHGEGFGEHGEHGHGLLLYQETVRVPLIVSGRGLAEPGTRRDEVVSLVDVMPTVLDALGLDHPPAIQGRSLVPLLRGRGRWQDGPVYTETYYPELHLGWSRLRSVIDGGSKLIESSELELYDLAADPLERHDLSRDDPRLLSAQRRLLRSLVERISTEALSPRAGGDAASVAALRSLGYLAGASTRDRGMPRPNPARKVELYGRLVRAREAMAGGDATSARRLFEDVLAEDESIPDAHGGLGEIELQARRFGAAAAAFGRALELRPEDPALLAALATALLQDGKPAEADAVATAGQRAQPRDARFDYLRGRCAAARGDLESARRHHQAGVRNNPRSVPNLVELAGILAEQGEVQAAEERLGRALALNPLAPGARLYLGQIRLQQGRIAQAERELRAALDDAGDFRPYFALAQLDTRRGRIQEAEELLRQTLALEPRFVAARLELAKLLLDRGDDPREAIEIVREALELRPVGREAALAYFLLADLYNRAGRDDLSAEFADRGREAAGMTAP